MSTKIISGPIFTTLQKSMRYSSQDPKHQKIFPCSGTIIASILPEQGSNSISATKPLAVLAVYYFFFF